MLLILTQETFVHVIKALIETKRWEDLAAFVKSQVSTEEKPSVKKPATLQKPKAVLQTAKPKTMELAKEFIKNNPTATRENLSDYLKSKDVKPDTRRTTVSKIFQHK